MTYWDGTRLGLPISPPCFVVGDEHHGDELSLHAAASVSMGALFRDWDRPALGGSGVTRARRRLSDADWRQTGVRMWRLW